MGVSSLFGGGSQPSQPSPPPIYPIDIPGTLNAANQLGIYQWNLSQDQWAAQYPGMVNAQNEEMQRAYDALTGPLDPELERAFNDTGISQALSAFGGGREDAGVTNTGSIGRNTIAASVANQTQNYQDYVRDWISQLMSQYPYPAQLGGSAAATLAGTNLQNLISAQYQARGYNAALGAANAQADQQRTAAAVGTSTQLVSGLLQGLAAAGVISM